MSQIKSFKIEKLHGYKDFELKFKDNTLILVGENGSGKTSVLRIFNYFLTCNWRELAKYNFEKVSITIDKKSYEISNSDLKVKFNISEKLLRRLPPPVRRNYIKAIENDEVEEIEWILSHYVRDSSRYQRSLFEDENRLQDKIIESRKIDRKLIMLAETINKNIDFTILYLPTYRRIEQELSFIFREEDEDELKIKMKKNLVHHIHSSCTKNHTELVEFGMNDVKSLINNVLENLKEFQRTELNKLTLKYLGDVVDKKYETANIRKIKQVSEDIIDNILDRIDEELLSNSTKESLRKTIQQIRTTSLKEFSKENNNHIMFICHYFSKLLNFQQLLEQRESKMREFCRICNKYITDKEFKYESSSFDFSIISKKDASREIQLNQLSSGEKQIVSLFSQLCLSECNDYFVMIDEPELSLSVLWQREFLVDIQNGEFCKGLFAVTHSPFIYDNELDKYTHGLGEFLI